MVATKLLVDAPSISPGGNGWMGVQLTIPDGWDIYWQNPGDSGIPTTMKWTLPDGVTVGDIHWPAPQRVSLSGLTNYGYRGTVVLPVPLQFTANKITGPLSVKVDWLVCHDTCIPESTTLTTTLPQQNGAEMLQAARDALPGDFPGKASFAVSDKSVQLSFIPSSAWDVPSQAEFFPIEDGVIDNSTTTAIGKTADGFSLTMARGTADTPATWHGVLRLQWGGKPATTYNVTATPGVAPLLTPPQHAPSFLWLALLAFAGGLLLNIMPCVLPILSLKALALVKKAHLSPRAARAQGIAFTLGVVASFLIIAGVMLLLKASGEAIGWGFQLQSPVIVGILALLMLGVSANLLGLFHLPPLLGQVMVAQDGLRGTFLTGALAVAVATPCTAPFMATAVGATLTLPAAASLVIFASMGVGMASPFLLISLWPAAQRLLPKPGHWMNRFRHLMAIPMLITAMWLFYVLAQLLHPVPMHARAGYGLITPIPYSQQKLAELRAANEPVFVDATAAWCLTCKINARVALMPEATQQYFRDHHITLMIADWTMRDAAITDFLATFGRNGVPIYVFYPPGGMPVVLPQLLTPAIVRNTLNANLNPA